MEFKFKVGAQPQGGSDGFWYDLVRGGYIKPEEVLIEKDQLIKLNEAIEIVSDFEKALEDNELLNEF